MIAKLSEKQRTAMLWWNRKKTADCCACIAHGAVRSGKTFAMSLGFVFWSLSRFDGNSFAFCGKTIRSVRRNVIQPLFAQLEKLSFVKITDHPSKNLFELTMGEHTCRYYLFGGKDESSAALIQGITLAGLFMDETALMPRSFVEQAVARCSVTGSKMWFNCNPDSPYHWFKKEWIDKAEEKNCCVIHFTLEDNPSLSREIIERYHRIYTGAFYRRFVLGEWCAAEGLVYPMFSPDRHCFDNPPEQGFESFVMSVDYGTVNPTSAGLWGKSGEVWYRVAEYYYDSKKEGSQRTDQEHYKALEKLGETAEAFGGRVAVVVCDPSAASFMECIRRNGEFAVKAAKNDVVSGIRRVSDALAAERIKISRNCHDCIREFSLYRWDERKGTDTPVKENDHAMDDVRYFASHFLNQENDGFCTLSVAR